MGLIKATKIEVKRAEGRTSECITVTLDTWDQANAVLRNWSHTAPAHGGYHKCDFTITWENGEKYQGRFDLVRHGNDSLQKHVREFCEFTSKRRRPWHMDEVRWEAYHREIVQEETRAACCDLLDNYQIGDDK